MVVNNKKKIIATVATVALVVLSGLVFTSICPWSPNIIIHQNLVSQKGWLLFFISAHHLFTYVAAYPIKPSYRECTVAFAYIKFHVFSAKTKLLLLLVVQF